MTTKISPWLDLERGVDHRGGGASFPELLTQFLGVGAGLEPAHALGGPSAEDLEYMLHDEFRHICLSGPGTGTQQRRAFPGLREANLRAK